MGAYVLLGQAVHAEAPPPPAKVPGAQVLQALEADAEAKRPTVQFLQAVAPMRGENDPAAQAEHADNPAAPLKAPKGHWKLAPSEQ